MKKAAAFTLIEMLMVMTIAVIALSLTRPALDLFAGDAKVGFVGDNLVGYLNWARQMAITTNHSVEVRFYQYAKPGMPGESAENAGSGKYRAFQAFQIQDDGSARSLGKVEYLPSTVMIDANTEFSSLMDFSLVKTWTSVDSQPKLSRADQYNCRAFSFCPNGDAALSSSTTWFLTLHKALTSSTASLPANFMTIQIDPLGGNITSYRP